MNKIIYTIKYFLLILSTKQTEPSIITIPDLNERIKSEYPIDADTLSPFKGPNFLFHSARKKNITDIDGFGTGLKKSYHSSFFPARFSNINFDGRNRLFRI